MRDTIFNNDEYHTTTPAMTNTSNITNETIKQNIKANHTRFVESYLNSQTNNELIGTKPPDVSAEESCHAASDSH